MRARPIKSRSCAVECICKDCLRVDPGMSASMTRPRSQKLAALIAVAWAIAQPATRSPLLASFWTLGAHADGLEHSLALEADAGHLDLVVSHAHADDCARSEVVSSTERANRPHLECCRANDHVVHLGVDPAARETSKAGLSVLQRAPTALACPVVALAPIAWLPPLPGVTEHLRTVVLRA